MDCKNWIKIEFPSESVNVMFARTTIAVFASQLELTLDEIEDIKVAVSEAVSNAVIHGYRNTRGIVVLEAKYSETELEICVEDFGHGIPDIAQAKEASFTTIPEERMGLGLVFIHELMDQVSIISEVDQGTKVIMTKQLNAIAN
ncbi:MAG: anti-sigma F factor [Firmicutes bacterium]|nr:anti-sigma F factor [Bacillota bacterium]